MKHLIFSPASFLYPKVSSCFKSVYFSYNVEKWSTKRTFVHQPLGSWEIIGWLCSLWLQLQATFAYSYTYFLKLSLNSSVFMKGKFGFFCRIKGLPWFFFSLITLKINLFDANLIKEFSELMTSCFSMKHFFQIHAAISNEKIIHTFMFLRFF